MPCYLFTFYAYRSWMPDRPRGFVKRGRGVLASDCKLAARYADRAAEAPVRFTGKIQQWLVDECQVACRRQLLRLHCIASDSTHLHVLVSWRAFRPSTNVRSSLKSSLTRRLNCDASRRTWFSNGASRNRVRDRRHLSYLLNEYLPAHRGWKWDERKGAFV